jgi:oligopeptidase A
MPLDSPPNPLLHITDLAQYDAIEPGHITPAVDELLAACRRVVAAVTGAADTPDWDSVVEPLDDALDRLGRAWGAVSHLNAVVDTPVLREQYNLNVPKLSAFWSELAQDVRLYQRYKALAAHPDFGQWPAARRRVIDNELRDFRLGGAELAAPAKERLRQVRDRLSQLSTRFAQNVLDATNAFALYVDEPDAGRLAGIPDDVLQMYREAAAADGRAGYKLTLQFPSYVPVQQYAHDRALREQLYRAYVTRAAEFGNPEWNNDPLMVEILALRREQARLLELPHYAALSLVPKMAGSAEEVERFLLDLAGRARPYAERDLRELRDFAARELQLRDLQAWDINYASEKLREARYAYSAQELKQYFTEPRVLAGLFKVIETLFSVAIVEDRAPLWHPEVKFYRIQTLQGEPVGHFYLDLYARDHKQGGAWQDDARSRRRATGRKLQTPVSYLTCNFARPVGGKPALLTHSDVLTLFHEFGHGLHHLLTEVDELAVSGTRGVEWDAVELPSQFMENFCWEWEVLQLLTAHVDTGAPLPRSLFDKMLAARNFQSAMGTLRQVEFALADMRLHAHFDPTGAGERDVHAVIEAVRREVAVVQPPAYNRMLNGFSHIFAGGYAAGYYSYKWAEVLSADAYAAFEEDGDPLNPARGARFRRSVLARGGSRPAMESFIEFRGRPPRIDALLRHHGMTN